MKKRIKLNNTKAMLVFAGCLPLMTAFSTQAQEHASFTANGWYGGLNIGQSRATIDFSGIRSSLEASGFNDIEIKENEQDFAYKIFAGYQFNEYFALESGFFDLGKFSYQATAQPTSTAQGSIKVRGLNFDLVGILPITEKFSAFARGGLNLAETRNSFSSTGMPGREDSRSRATDPNYKLGAGLQYALNENFALRAEVERYRVKNISKDRGDIDFYSVGLVYRFGGQSSPAPRPATPRAAALTEQYCSILDIQFDIAQDKVQPVDEEKLSVVGTFLTKYPGTTAVIEAHSDNVGKPAYNMALSQRRARNVVNHLVENYQIAPSRLQAVGFGASRPVADNSSTEGQRSNRRIHAIIDCAADIEGLKPVAARVTVGLLVEFDHNKADVRPRYRKELRNVADFLKANPGVTATIEGHTDNADPALAMELSQRRAQNVVDYLADNFSVERSRLNAAGFGETRRTAYNSSAAGRQENRRVNILFNYPQEK